LGLFKMWLSFDKSHEFSFVEWQVIFFPLPFCCDFILATTSVEYNFFFLLSLSLFIFLFSSLTPIWTLEYQIVASIRLSLFLSNCGGHCGIVGTLQLKITLYEWFFSLYKWFFLFREYFKNKLISLKNILWFL